MFQEVFLAISFILFDATVLTGEKSAAPKLQQFVKNAELTMNKYLLSLNLLVIAFVAVNAGTLEDWLMCYEYCEDRKDDKYNGNCLWDCLEDIEQKFPHNPFKTIDWRKGYKVDKSTQTEELKQCKDLCEGADRCPNKHKGRECIPACEEAQNKKLSEKQRNSALKKFRDILSSCFINPDFYH